VGFTVASVRFDTDEVWWLYGPPCVGKSTTAWELYDHLMGGEPRAYFDVDQVGMCRNDKIAGHCDSHYLVEFLSVERLPPVSGTG